MRVADAHGDPEDRLGVVAVEVAAEQLLDDVEVDRQRALDRLAAGVG